MEDDTAVETHNCESLTDAQLCVSTGGTLPFSGQIVSLPTQKNIPRVGHVANH